MSIQYEEPALARNYGVVDSFPKDFGYGVEEPDIEEESTTSGDSKPRIDPADGIAEKWKVIYSKGVLPYFC